MGKQIIVDGRKVATETVGADAASNPFAAPAAPTADGGELAALKAALAAKEAEIEALRASRSNGGVAGQITFFVTDGHVDAKTGKQTSRGAISLYGLGRWPMTLYVQQWERLAEVLTGKRPCVLKGKRDAKTGAPISATFSALMEQARRAGVLSMKE